MFFYTFKTIIFKALVMEGFKAHEDLPLGQDIMPTLSPIAAALYDGTLHTNCSACFSPLSEELAYGPIPHQVPDKASTVLYCSLRCSLLDSYLHISSGEHNLLSFKPDFPHSVHIRLALRLVYIFKRAREERDTQRIQDLNLENIETHMRTMRDRLMTPGSIYEKEILEKITREARVLSFARKSLGNIVFEEQDELEMAEMVLCLVQTRAVEVHDKSGINIGATLYGTEFSRIRHSCSPNAFLTPVHVDESLSGIERNMTLRDASKVLFSGGEKYGPKLRLRSMKAIKKGEEVTISYLELLKPKNIRQEELWWFHCHCKRCSAEPTTYVDSAIEAVYILNPNNCPENISNHDY